MAPGLSLPKKPPPKRKGVKGRQSLQGLGWNPTVYHLAIHSAQRANGPKGYEASGESELLKRAEKHIFQPALMYIHFLSYRRSALSHSPAEGRASEGTRVRRGKWQPSCSRPS